LKTFIFICPQLEYACEVWDNRGEMYTKTLENIQLEAARIVTGLPVFTKKVFRYRELGCETLENRRNNRKLIFFLILEMEHRLNTFKISCLQLYQIFLIII